MAGWLAWAELGKNNEDDLTLKMKLKLMKKITLKMRTTLEIRTFLRMRAVLKTMMTSR